MFDALKVCFVAGTLGQGGAERQLFYMVKALAENGGHPRVLTLVAGEFWQERIEALGVPVTWVGQRASRLENRQRLRRPSTEWTPHRWWDPQKTVPS